MTGSRRSTPIRVYADTSVYGGCFDEEFARASAAFFQDVRNGRIDLVVSAAVVREIDHAPPALNALYDEMLAYAGIVEFSDEAVSLHDSYLAAGVVTTKWSEDALHVAVATVARCQMIVSWNFRHIVHFDKIASPTVRSIRVEDSN